MTDKAAYTLTREITVEDGYDVIVAGSGPSGCAAAVSVARLGAKVLLGVHSSIRMMPVCYTTGQAAGTAAVQVIRTGQTACTLNTRTLVENLRENGAILPQETLSDEMSRKLRK